jgi:hypothetical protein
VSGYNASTKSQGVGSRNEIRDCRKLNDNGGEILLQVCLRGNTTIPGEDIKVGPCKRGSYCKGGISIKCGITEYQDEDGQSECKKCGENTASSIEGSDSHSNCKAKEGFYLRTDLKDDTSNRTVGLRCHPSVACNSSLEDGSRCSKGYNRDLCSHCVEGYYRASNMSEKPEECLPCDQERRLGTYVGYLCGILIANLLIVTFIVSRRLNTTTEILKYRAKGDSPKVNTLGTDIDVVPLTRKNRLSAAARFAERKKSEINISVLIRVILSHLQVMSMVSEFKFTFPSSPDKFIASASLLSNVNIVFEFQSSLKCLLYRSNTPEPVNALLIAVGSLLLTCIAVILFWLARSYLVSRKLIFRNEEMVYKLYLSIVAVCYLFYSRIFEAWARLFSCLNIDNEANPDYRFTGALYIHCYDEEHYWWLLNVGVPVGVLLVGLVIYPLYTLLKHVHELQASEKLLSTLGFIYCGFRNSVWWWEFLTLFRKLCISGIVIFFSASSFFSTTRDTELASLKALSATAVLITSLVLTLLLHPFESVRMNAIEALGLGVSSINMVYTN